MQSRIKWDCTFPFNGKKKHNGYITDWGLDFIRAYNSSYLGERAFANVSITWQGRDHVRPWKLSIPNQLASDGKYFEIERYFKQLNDARQFAKRYFNTPRRNPVSIRSDGKDTCCWAVRMKGIKGIIAGVLKSKENEWRVYSYTHTQYRASGTVVHSLREAKEVAAREWFAYQGLLWQLG